MAEMTTLRRTYKYRLYPTRRQVVALEQQLGAACDIYNAALEQRKWAWRCGQSITEYEQSRELTVARRAGLVPEGMNAWVQGEVLRRLDGAFQGFFRRVAAGQNPGYPRFRSRARYDSLTWGLSGNGGGCAIHDGRLRLQGIGHVKVKWHRNLPDEAKLCTVTVRRRAGRWYVGFALELPAPSSVPLTGQDVGIDLGVSTFAATSDGELISGPRAFRASQKRLRRAQRKVARRKRGSHRRRKARVLVGRQHERLREKRRDHAHKTARGLVERYDRIYIENLNVAGLARGWLAKDVSDQGWAAFVAALEAKAEEAGREVVAVDPKNTSQFCSECGTLVPKDLSVRIHSCGCGYQADRDVNAARNVLRVGLALQASTQEVCVA